MLLSVKSKNQETVMNINAINKAAIFLILIVSFSSCVEEPEIIDGNNNGETNNGNNNGNNNDQSAIAATFGNNIDLNNLLNYANQNIPNYITEDNTENNPITNAGATLGRVLFYDKNLSINNTISCASCHNQANAFGDLSIASLGVNGRTGRHSMRLINARFGEEDRFFWDERAPSLEAQTTQPIQDHIEMGFSGQNGDLNFTDLIVKLETIDYYSVLFNFVYGDEDVTETRIQNALAQFIRSIQSFDSRYDQGRVQAQNNNAPFNNFTNQENNGKELFMRNPQFNNNGIRVGGGIGCNRCHNAPEFSINDNSRNNGVIATIDGNGIDVDVTRSPTLRDVFNANGDLNGPLMHTGSFNSIEAVLDHYNQIQTNGNNNLDNRLRPNGNGQNLAMTQQEKDAVVAFLKTLSGTTVYVDERWSDPFLQ